MTASYPATLTLEQPSDSHIDCPACDEADQAEDGIDLQQVAQILLRIVARLPKTEYSNSRSNGFVASQAHTDKTGTTILRWQAAESPLDDLPDPASVIGTSQG